MEVFDRPSNAGDTTSNQANARAGLSPAQREDGARALGAALDKVEQTISTSRVDPKEEKEKRDKKRGSETFGFEADEDVFDELLNGYDSDSLDILGCDADDSRYASSFTQYVLKPIQVTPEQKQHRRNSTNSASSGLSGRSGTEQDGVHALSLEYLVELEKNPWHYSSPFPMLSMEDDNVDGDRAEVMAENPQGAMSRRGFLDRSIDRRGSGAGSIVEGCEVLINKIDVALWNMPSVSTVIS